MGELDIDVILGPFFSSNSDNLYMKKKLKKFGLFQVSSCKFLF
jgi:hypothetical protein